MNERQRRVCRRLRDAGGAASVKALADMEAGSSATGTRTTLRALARAGLVERASTGPKGWGEELWRLTDEGRAAVAT